MADPTLPLFSSSFTRQARDMISLGVVKGWGAVQKFGHNTDLSSTLQDVWAQGGTYTYLTSAVTLEAISDDANDTADGSGARIITIQGLDANFLEISEDVTLAGLSASSATSKSFIRINRAYVKTCGTYGIGSAGDITIRTSSGGAIHALIEQTSADSVAWDAGQTQIARYTVPAGKVAFMTKVEASCEANKRADFGFYRRENADTVSAPFTPKRIFKTLSGVSGSVTLDFEAPIIFLPKTDIIIKSRLSSGANGRVEVGFTLFVGPAF